jgi:2-amino-4-hydroxy-6-hydroxymethyldihydropteridine diphosphokinase
MVNQTAFVALGSNLGEPAAIITRAAGRMEGILPGVCLAARSRIWHTAPHELGKMEYPRPECLLSLVEGGLPAQTNNAAGPGQGSQAQINPKQGCQPPAVPWYANMVVRLDCALPVTPEDLFEALMALERDLGRNRLMESRYGPRFLDIDLLAFADAVRDTPRLTLPHPRMSMRAFVLLPLQEIAVASRLLDNLKGSSHVSCDTLIF